MILRIRFPTDSNNLKISLPKNKYLLWQENLVSPKQLIHLYQVFTRHLNMECFELAVPADFVSYAPTFFIPIFFLTYTRWAWKMGYGNGEVITCFPHTIKYTGPMIYKQQSTAEVQITEFLHKNKGESTVKGMLDVRAD